VSSEQRSDELTSDGPGPSAFHGLLNWLAPEDPEQAGQHYEGLRRRLLRLYEWRGADLAETLADETLDRVARRLAEGEEIHTPDPYRYVCGVARRVFHELIRRESRQRRILNRDGWPLSPPTTAAERHREEHRLDCLSAALDELSSENRTMILRYYQGDGGEKIANRKALAEEFDIPINALRIRMHRIRLRLEEAVRDCLQRSSL